MSKIHGPGIHLDSVKDLVGDGITWQGSVGAYREAKYQGQHSL